MKKYDYIKRPKLLIMVLLFMTSATLVAQHTVKGVVTIAGTSETLPGVNIMVKNTNKGTTTDIDGHYVLEIVEQDPVLIFSYTGFKSQEIAVQGRTIINISMEEAVEMLEEFVVIGYGTVRKSDLTGAVSSVKADDIRKITSHNPAQALQGKVTGVQVTTTSGAPGAGIAVRIRGVGTFNNSSPIYVVDGVILDDISFLNAGDIQSMEVLKDASATAIYGSRGSNGVILITTARGTEQTTQPIITFNAEYGIQSLAKKIDLLNGKEFAIISNEIRPGSYNNVDAVPNTDWQDLVFRSAPLQNHQLTISGGSKNTSYYLGIGLLRQDGIIPKSRYQRLSIKLNNTYKLGEFITLGNNITLAPYQQQNAPNDTYSVYRAQPLLSPYYDDGSFGVVHNVGNPLADLHYSNNFNNGVRGVGNIFAEANILKNIRLKSSLGIDAAYNKATNFVPAYTVFNPDGTASQQDNPFNRLFKGQSENLSWLWENTLSYSLTYGKHQIDALAGYTMQHTSSEFVNLSGRDIIRDEKDFWYLGPVNIMDEISNMSNGVSADLFYSMISLLSRINYTYDNKYILTTTFRRDGSSKFAPSHRFSNFPSFALGWNIGNESFMQSLALISMLKIRASWGMIGNEKISYFDRFAMINSGLFAIFSNPDAAFPAATYGKSGNPDLRWETSTQTDIGLEIGLLNNRLTGEFDYYHRITDDILVELSTPGHLGNGQGQRVRYNAASVLNRGFEFNLRWREIKGDLSYSIGLLGTTIHNEVLEIGGSSGIDSVLLGGYLANGQAVTRSMVGLPIGAFYGYVTDGLFQNDNELAAYPHMSLARPGDLRFVDLNNDQVINGLDRSFIGSPIPKFILGFNLELGYKNFDLSLDLQAQTANKIFNGKDVVRPDPYNFEAYVFDRWTGEGTSDKVPRPSFGGYNYTPSDFFVQDGSFLRLRSLIIGYTLSETISGKLLLSSIRLYLKGSNLYTLTRYTGYTPEIGGYDVLSNGIDHGVYPISAVYSFGIHLQF
ncbi:MAG: TonB-dependent receptor [Bacteroidales bacterium]|jgi:TonB-linked SusC/RagA family outer membrane protein|nr:TonB-dependent receptor [Bacteroidales bacterium]MDD3701122.1 TonB-dependent receptor [Bacteroidales bacterium]MDY0368569.1 TonB-dependent receptor [Bacteroidales bacterium]